MKERIMRFLSEKLFIDFDAEIDEHADLFQLGLMDSQSYIEVIRFIESEFGLRLTDEQILSNVFVSVDGMVAFVAQQSQQTRPEWQN